MELTPELLDAINSLGTLKHIVSPNYEHIKFARQVRVHTGDSSLASTMSDDPDPWKT